MPLLSCTIGLPLTDSYKAGTTLQISKLELSHGLFLVGHDEDGGHEEEDADGVLGVEHGVLEVKLQNEVQDHLEAPEDVGLARAHPPAEEKVVSNYSHEPKLGSIRCKQIN